MNLDDLEYFKQIDSQDLLSRIDSLPEQLQQAWDAARSLPLAGTFSVQNFVITASGDFAVAAELAAASVSSEIRLPVSVHRGFGLPAFASDQTLVLCLGEAEETQDAFRSALANGCRLFVIAPGSVMQSLADENQVPVWSSGGADFVHAFALLLAFLSRAGLVTDPSPQLQEAVQSMQASRAHLRAEVQAANNAAKRYAGQLVGRWVSFVGAGRLSPIALRWKMRVNQMAKAAANAEAVPDAGYHAAYAVMNPAPLLNSSTMTLFLRAPADDPRDRMRSDMMRQHYLLEGMNTDFVDARGESVLANIWTLILFGEYMAYYLAMAYGVDPS